MGQVPFIFKSAYAAYLNAVKGAVTAVHLVKNYKHTDTHASRGARRLLESLLRFSET
jgi:hypothetical protein